MKHQIELILGDWSGDGHSQTESFHILSNLNSREIYKAFQAGVKILGFDITDFCSDYEDTEISVEFFSALATKGMDVSGYYITLDNTSTVNLDSNNYFSIYLFTIKLGNPSFNYEVNKMSQINVGGYGFFV